MGKPGRAWGGGVWQVPFARYGLSVLWRTGMRTAVRHTIHLRPVIGFVLSAAALVALFLSSTTPCLAREPYRIGYTPGVLISMEAKNRLEVVYARAGLPVEFVALPQTRSLGLSVEGSLDGEAGRVAGLETQYPSMIRVGPRLLGFNGVAYVIKGQRIGQFREELLDVMKVGSLCGIIWVEKIMRGRSLEQVKTYDALFNMLLEGRIDIALASLDSAESFLCGFRGHGRIELLEPIVYQTMLYHYLNRKNADIAPLLEKALRELRAEDYWHDAAGE